MLKNDICGQLLKKILFKELQLKELLCFYSAYECNNIILRLQKMEKDADRALNFLIQVLATDNEHLKYNAVVTIGKIGYKASSAIPFLVQIIDVEKINDIKLAAVEALGQISTKALPAIRFLVELITDVEEINDIKLAAVEALGQSGKKAVQPLIEVFNDKPTEVCILAIKALARIGQEAHLAIELVQRLLDHSGFYVQLYAAECLCDIGGNISLSLSSLKQMLDVQLQMPNLPDSVYARYAIYLALLGIGRKYPKYRMTVCNILQESEQREISSGIKFRLQKYLKWLDVVQLSK